MTLTYSRAWGMLALSALLITPPVWAQKAYSPGASDTEIKLGQSTPLSGPASAFGAGAGRAVVGYFELHRRDYRRIAVDEQVEVLSLLGDITRDDSGVNLHLHTVLGLPDGSTRGGHLLEAVVRPTLEVILSETPAHLQRRRDPQTGLALLAPNAD